MSWKGELLHIHIADAGSRPMRALTEARLVPGIGIEGDRYATRRGTYSDRHNVDREVPLNHLVGRYFSVGGCVLRGERLNVPCRYLEDLLGKKVFKPMLNRSGLKCRIETGGVIRPGMAIEPCP
jgi:hypothetical protein